jgi:hypothetical protein
MDKRKRRRRRQTIEDKTVNRKQTIDQHEPHSKPSIVTMVLIVNIGVTEG